MLLSNYSDMEYIYNLDVEDFIELVVILKNKTIKEMEDKREEMLFHRWGYELPLMKEYITFADYKKLAYKKPIYGFFIC